MALPVKRNTNAMLESVSTLLLRLPATLLWTMVLTLGFVLGGIPVGYLIARIGYGIDLTKEGSGSTGGTNVMRLCGKKAGALAYFLDFAKAAVPLLVLRYFLPNHHVLHLAFGVAIVIGHSKSIFLAGKGGKSAMSSLGVIFALSPLAGVICGVMALSIILISRMVSVGSIITGLLSWVVMYFVGGVPLPYILFTAFAGLFVLYRHMDNIKRIMNGMERRI
jgi:acyl phosphate:glycerol-3-phosphate acyltransferase